LKNHFGYHINPENSKKGEKMEKKKRQKREAQVVLWFRLR